MNQRATCSRMSPLRFTSTTESGQERSLPFSDVGSGGCDE